MAAFVFAPVAYAPVAPPAGMALKASPVMSAETFKKFVDSNVADTTLEKPWTSGEVCRMRLLLSFCLDPC